VKNISLRAAQRNRSNQKGSTMVESGLILFVFVTMLIGICDVSQVLFIHHSVTERVRSAVRYGAINVYDRTAIENMVLYNAPAAPADGSSAAFNLDRTMVTVQRLDAGSSQDRISVSVANYPLTLLTPFIAGNVKGLPISGVLPYEIN
jgi:Flp pilus assembly protein TadG